MLLLRDRRGTGLVEYATLVGLVALVALAGFRFAGRRIDAKARAQARCVETLDPSGCTAGDGPNGRTKDAATSSPRTKALAGVGHALGCDASGHCSSFGACFAAGTPVATLEGPRAIESVAVGDRVLAQDAATGERTYKPVVRTFERVATSLVALDVVHDDGRVERVRATAEHPFRVGGRWIAAADLALGDAFTTPLGSARVASLASEVAADGAQPVFNIEVADFHTYFVGAGGILVHNDCKGEGGKAKGGSHGLAVRTETLVEAADLIDKCLATLGGKGVAGESLRHAAEELGHDAIKVTLRDTMREIAVDCSRQVLSRYEHAPEDQASVAAEVKKCVDAASAKLQTSEFWQERLKETAKDVGVTAVAPLYATLAKCSVAAGYTLLGPAFEAAYHDVWGEFPTSWADLDREYLEKLSREHEQEVEVTELSGGDGRLKIEIRPLDPRKNYFDGKPRGLPRYQVRIHYDGRLWTYAEPGFGSVERAEEWQPLESDDGVEWSYRDHGPFYVKLRPRPGDSYAVDVSRSGWWSWVKASGKGGVRKTKLREHEAKAE